jgi:proton-dependent oligopeptide transporter, POT family
MSSFTKVIRKLPRVFWVSNLMELFERWAWYGFYNSFALYLTLSKDTGALGFSQAQKAAIMGTGSMLLYFLPLITGAIADRIGFKKVLILSFTTYIIGFYITGNLESYAAVYAAYLFLAFAGALFKPIISGMIAKTTDEETSSIGFGIFYMMINVGGFIGPFIAGMLYKLNWNYVFLMSIITVGLNYIFVFFFFKEPGREKSTVTFLNNVGHALKNIWITLLDFKYVLFLVIMAAFWTAFNQLFYSFPVFLEDWADLDAFAQSLGIGPGKITAVTITSLDAFFIIAFQIIVSTIAMRYKPLHAMMTGIAILAVGVGLMFFTQMVWLTIFGVLIFSIGEMASSPKFTEYIGRIAPPDKKALYMGTSFLPIAAGHKLAGILSGDLYANIAEKFTLLTQEVEKRGLDLPEVSETFTRTDYLNMAGNQMQMSGDELTQYLWNTYHPERIWMVYSGIAIGAAFCLFLYDRFVLGKKTS